MMLRFLFGRRTEMVTRVCAACAERRSALRMGGTRTWQPGEARCGVCTARAGVPRVSARVDAGNPAAASALTPKQAAFA